MSNSHPLRPLASVSEIDHIHLLAEQLGALVLGEEYSDVTFIVEGKRFPAHRVILAARCHYFRLVGIGFRVPVLWKFPQHVRFALRLSC